MLSYNSIVYIAYTLVLIVIITCLTYMNAEACSGYDLVEKTEMQDERTSYSDIRYLCNYLFVHLPSH